MPATVHTETGNGGVSSRDSARPEVWKTGRSIQLVIFRLGDQRYALPLAAVERIVRAAEVTALPHAPSIVLGVLDVQGRIFPVLDIRRRFGQPPREIVPSDQFLIARTAARAVILAVDEVEGVFDCPNDEIINLTRIAPGSELFPGVVRLGDGLILIHDLERFLSPEEARDLDEAMRREKA